MTDQAAAPLDERVERGLVGIAEEAGVAFVDHDDVGVFQGGTAGRMESAIDNGPVLGQNLAPVGQKLRIVVLTGRMRLEARPNEHVHPGGVLALRPGRPLRAGASSGLRPGRWLRRPREEQQK